MFIYYKTYLVIYKYLINSKLNQHNILTWVFIIFIVQVPSSSSCTATKEPLVVHKSYRNELLKDINVYSHRDITPNCKKLYYKAMKLKKKSDRLLQNKNKFKSRVQLTEKFAKMYTNNNNMLNKLNYNNTSIFSLTN